VDEDGNDDSTIVTIIIDGAVLRERYCDATSTDRETELRLFNFWMR